MTTLAAHGADVADLRVRATHATHAYDRLAILAAADLLELHDRTSLSLDDWPAARALVEALVGHPIQENGV